MNRHLGAGALAALLLAFSGTAAVAADPIKIGLISARSGVFALFGTSGEKGAVLAAEEINAAGGVLGRPLELMAADDMSKPAEASRHFREMVAAGAEVVLGAIGSGETQAVSTLAKEDKVPFFTVLGYTRFLTEEAGHRYFFRPVSNSRTYYGPMVDRLLEGGYKTYCTINNDFAFGHDLNESVVGTLKEKGGIEVLPGCEFWAPLGETNFSTYLTTILAHMPDVVMFGGLVGPSGRAFVAQAKQFGLFDNVVGAHPALGWPANNAGLQKEDIPENGIITAGDYPYPPLKTEASQAFFKAYTARWNDLPMSEGASGYATMYLIANAFKKAGKVDREAFIDAVEDMKYVHPSLGELQMRPFDHQGTAGVWVGYLSWDEADNRPGMSDITYVPGEKYLPTKEEIEKLRAGN